MNQGEYEVPAGQRGRDAAVFATKRETPTRNPATRVVQIGAVYEQESVLDLPCGDGMFAVAYAAKCRAVVALDSRQPLLEMAQALIRKRELENVHVRRVGDPGDLRLPPGQFDLVVCHHLGSFEDPEGILNEAKKQAKRMVVWAEPVGPENRNGRNFLDSLLEQRNGYPSHSLSESQAVALSAKGGWVLQERAALRHLRKFSDWAGHLARDEKDALRDDLVDDMEPNDADLFPHFSGRELSFLERWLVLCLVRG